MSKITLVVPSFGPSSNVKYIIPLPELVVGLFITFTVLSITASLPALSLTLYVILYVPILFVFTFPSLLTFDVISPSHMSEALKPGSVQVFPKYILISLFPFKVICGAVLSSLVIFLLTVVLFPDESVTVYIISFSFFVIFTLSVKSLS